MTHLHTLGWTANNGAQLFAVGWLGGLSEFVAGIGGWIATAVSSIWIAQFSGTTWKPKKDYDASWDANNCRE